MPRGARIARVAIDIDVAERSPQDGSEAHCKERATAVSTLKLVSFHDLSRTRVQSRRTMKGRRCAMSADGGDRSTMRRHDPAHRACTRASAERMVSGASRSMP